MVGLINSWRRRWGQDFPVIYVQKPSGGGTPFATEWKWTLPNVSPKELVSGGYYREIYQSLALMLQLTGVYMASAVDLEGGLHPGPKNRYGKRLVDLALLKEYGQTIDCLHPRYLDSKVDGKQIKIRFTQVGKGLTTPNQDPPGGFMIAGKDRQFVWAQAKIEGDTVVVWSDAVAEPVAVRYAWAAQVQWANLFGKNELPVLTFRSDDWPEVKKP